MKIVRWARKPGQSNIAVRRDGGWYDASSLLDGCEELVEAYGGVEAWSSMAAAGSAAVVTAIPWLQEALAAGHASARPVDAELLEAGLQAPLWGGGLIYCAALNYHSHVAEAGARTPERPLFFFKPHRCIVPPDGAVVMPDSSSQVDYECELAVVVGRAGKRIAAADAYDHIAAFTVIDDVSFRDLQHRKLPDGSRGMVDWVSAKALDTACPVGPWLVTSDEVGDADDLALRLWVNGELRQNGRTSDMVFGIAELVEDLSRDITLEVGDVIATGTCGGVGKASGRFLQHGDSVELAVQRVGRFRHSIVAPDPTRA